MMKMKKHLRQLKNRVINLMKMQNIITKTVRFNENSFKIN